MRYGKTLAATAVIAAISLPAFADYTVKGSVDCEAIIKEDANENYREFNKWWLLGYFSARNYVADIAGDKGSVGKGIDDDNLYSMALDYCKANRNGDWDDASRHVYDLLD